MLCTHRNIHLLHHLHQFIRWLEAFHLISEVIDLFHLWLVVESILILHSPELLEIWDKIIPYGFTDLLVFWWVIGKLFTILLYHILQFLDIGRILIFRIPLRLLLPIQCVGLIVMIVGLYRVAEVDRYFLIFIMMHFIDPI